MLQFMLIMFKNVDLNLISVTLLSAVEFLKTLIIFDLIRAKLVNKLKQLVNYINKLTENL